MYMHPLWGAENTCTTRPPVKARWIPIRRNYILRIGMDLKAQPPTSIPKFYPLDFNPYMQHFLLVSLFLVVLFYFFPTYQVHPHNQQQIGTKLQMRESLLIPDPSYQGSLAIDLKSRMDISLD